MENEKLGVFGLGDDKSLTNPIQVLGGQGQGCEGQNWDRGFIGKMKNAMIMSSFKYGNVTNKQGMKALVRIQEEIEVFRRDGNLEHMVNVANWAMMRFMFPQQGEAYRGTDSNESTRKVYKEVREWLRDYILENE